MLDTEVSRANLSGADLSGAVLAWARLEGANLSGANLRGAVLQSATLVDADLTGADLTGCYTYGVSAWDLKLEGIKQQNLVITRTDEPTITVDNIEVAQFIYLMLHNQKIRDVIDTITSKVVLILGRFTDERKAVLDALREELRKRNYLPILFDCRRQRNEPCGPIEVHPAEVRRTEVSLDEVRLDEVRLDEERPAEVRPAEVRPEEVRVGEARLAEVRPDEFRFDEFRPGEVRPGEARPAQIRPRQVRVCCQEHSTGTLDDCARPAVCPCAAAAARGQR
jgi:pentapeptide repeat protein